MKTLLITSPGKPDVNKTMNDDEFYQLLINTFGTDTDGTINAMQVKAILLAGNNAIIGSTVWSLL